MAIKTLSAVGLFCEDIRDEKSGSSTIIGTFSDNIIVPVLPGTMPKLGFYVRIHINFDFKTPIELRLKHTDGQILSFGMFDLDLIKKTIADTKSQGSPYATLIIQGVAAMFAIPKEGRVLLTVNYDKTELIVAHANFIMKAPPTI